MSSNGASYTLPARYYLDPELYRRDLESFFFNHWIVAGRTEELARPGEYFLREIAGESVIVVRESKDSIHAFYNVCRHRGTRLCDQHEGSVGSKIVCPYHGWSYGLDGALMGAPHMDAATFRREDYPLHKIAADVWDGHIFLNLSKQEPAPLRAQLGGLVEKFAPWRMGELKRRHRIVYDLKANWKLIVANYNECLHCPLVHPALNRLTDYLGADNEAPQSNYIGGYMGFRPGMETMTMDGQRHREYLPGLNSDERQQVHYYAVYPNFLLSLHPDYMLTHILWPRAADRTEIICDFHFQDGEAEIADAVEFWDCINREDWKIVEASQAGISSRSYQPGPYSPREMLLAGFDQEVVRRHEAAIAARM